MSQNFLYEELRQLTACLGMPVDMCSMSLGILMKELYTVCVPGSACNEAGTQQVSNCMQSGSVPMIAAYLQLQQQDIPYQKFRSLQ